MPPLELTFGIWDDVTTTPQICEAPPAANEPRAAIEELVAGFPEERRDETRRILTRVEALAQRRVAAPETAVDGFISEAEFFDVFYDTRPLPNGIKDPLCTSFDTAEEIIGRFPSLYDYPETEDGTMAGRRAIISWWDKEKFLGQVADTLQKSYGATDKDGTALSVGKGCYITTIPNRPRPTAPEKIESPAPVKTPPRDSPLGHDQILSLLDDAYGIYENVKDLRYAFLYCFAYVADYNATLQTHFYGLNDFEAALNKLQSALAENGDALDSREYVHVQEQANELEIRLSEGRADYQEILTGTTIEESVTYGEIACPPAQDDFANGIFESDIGINEESAEELLPEEDFTEEELTGDEGEGEIEEEEWEEEDGKEWPESETENGGEKSPDDYSSTWERDWRLGLSPTFD